ncbi:hypothetical protein [Microscilla marina]|uniref:Uncharacterized protein n=1 Tax=Microscilla marina ATCC 23134 TaxID=313606 RepID=A1ZKX4_MICM2|nr:hypothetical protein [Microscilla marina]EAY28940.1 conserved hypothetical protein [Microscilla marina ATCC 23134]
MNNTQKAQIAGVILSAILAIAWLSRGVYVGGCLLTLTTILLIPKVYPSLIKTWKPSIAIVARSLIFILAMTFGISADIKVGNKGLAYIAKAHQSLKDGDIAKAKVFLNQSKTIAPFVKDSAEKIEALIVIDNSEEYIKKQLISLSDDQFTQLMTNQSQLQVDFTPYKIINDRIKQKMKEKSQYRFDYAKKLRKKVIEAQFSIWDGSHVKLTKHIKSKMNDPDSFKHVSSSWVDMIKHVKVQTIFRGKNSFGGIVTHTVVAKVSFEGDVLEIISFK